MSLMNGLREEWHEVTDLDVEVREDKTFFWAFEMTDEQLHGAYFAALIVAFG